MPRRKRGDGPRCHLNVLLTAAEYDAINAAAVRQGKTLTGYVRGAVKAKLLADERYYYIMLEDGSVIPPLTEPGFEDSANAHRAAARRGGTVVERQLVTV